MSDEFVIAEYYRRYRSLARPRTNCFDLLAFLALLAASSLLLSVIIVCIYRLQSNVDNVFTFSNGLLIWRYTFSFLVLLSLKDIAIICIKIYQHYASEHTRRKCVCMPSCSVYALMVLRKYSFFKAVRLIIKRLERCSGPVCFIDYP
jgi:putative component of membrane protein insertase Oxa1/YidC/SpoIIIJ protein YidD